MTLNDIYLLVNLYLIQNHPVLDDAVCEVEAFLHLKQSVGLLHAFSVRPEYGRHGSPGMIVDFQSDSTTNTHQLFFSEQVWMQTSAAGTSTLVSHTDVSAPSEAPEDAFDDAFDRAMNGM